MKASVLKKLLASALTVYGSVMAPAALAGQTWNLGDTAANLAADGGTTTSGCARSAGGGFGNSVNCNTGANTPITSTVTGWVTANTSGGSTFTTGYLSNQGGNGIGLQDRSESTGSPYHTVDSINNSELIAIQFSKAISLRSVTLGWSSGDSDFSVLAWTGATPPPTLAGAIDGKTVNGANGLVTAGWKLVGQYGDVGGSAPDLSGNSGTDTDRNIAVNSGKTQLGDTTNGTIFSSSYWLIAAFNSSYATGGTGGLGLDTVADTWKLLSVAGTAATSVPEPGSVALVAVALVGALGVRRSRVKFS